MPPTNKKAGAAKFKKYAVLAGSGSSRRAVIAFVNRAEIAAATRIASQTIAMLGRTDPKRPAHSIAERIARSSVSAAWTRWWRSTRSSR